MQQYNKTNNTLKTGDKEYDQSTWTRSDQVG